MKLQGGVAPINIMVLALADVLYRAATKTVHLLGALCRHLLTLRVLQIGPRKFDRLRDIDATSVVKRGV